MGSPGTTWPEFVKSAEVLRSICDAVIDTSNKYKGAKISDSPASREENAIPAPAIRFFDSAFKSGSQSLIAATDHGMSLYRALRGGPMLSFAPWASAREILETCAASIWLLDVHLTPVERYFRGLVAELQDIDSITRYFRKSGDLEMVSKFETDAQSLLRQAHELGIEQRVRKGRPPNISKRIEETIADSRVYAMLSPVAHGNPRMSMVLGTERVLRSQRAMITGLTVDRANWLVQLPARWIARSFRVQSELFGWDISAVELMPGREFEGRDFGGSTKF